MERNTIQYKPRVATRGFCIMLTITRSPGLFPNHYPLPTNH